MNAAGPWDTPTEDPSGGSHRWLTVLGSWGMAGAAVGTSVGGVLQATRGVAGAAATWGTAGIALGALVGAAALVVERRAAEQRPLLLDAHGRLGRPLHGALFAVPVLVSLPALGLLGLVAALATGSVVPLVGFLLTAVVVAWAGLRVWSSHRFTRALEAVEEGDLGAARDRLVQLAERWPVSRSARVAARLNLAMMDLSEGHASSALAWLEGLRGAEAWASAGRALALVLLGRHDEAGEALAIGLNSPGARQVQGELDAVRVLLVWRTEGADAARALGHSLGGPAASPLHRALNAALGTYEGSYDDEVGALLASGLGERLPELAALRVPV